jgi:RNA polymerase primary sigma factor
MIDDDLENSGLRELIEKGREQGYITFADINDYLPDEVSDPDQLDEVIQIINDLGLQQIKILLKRQPKTKWVLLSQKLVELPIR